jgi:hypothetical protein
MMPSSSLWQRFQKYFLHYGDLDFSIDISRMRFPDDFFEKMQPRIEKAFAAMEELESGAIANPDEKRMVGHYWLRNPALAPSAQFRADIEETNKRNQTVCGRCSRRKNRGRRPETIRAPAANWNWWFGARAAIRGGRARIVARSDGISIFSTTPIRMASIASSTTSAITFGKRSSSSFRNPVERRKREMEWSKRKQNSKRRDFNSPNMPSP